MGRVMFSGGKVGMSVPVAGILASALAVGSVVKLMEGGVATEYLVVNQGIPSGSSLYDDSCDGTWLLRKDIKESRQLHNSANFNNYQNSTIHAWLNGDFFNLLGSIEQSTIKQVKIPYVNGYRSVASGSNGISTKIFLLSGYEIGFTQSDHEEVPIDGGKLSYFGHLKNTVAFLNGEQIYWWLRSLISAHRGTGWVVNVGLASTSVTSSYGIRPALIIPSTAKFDYDTMILKGVA